MVDQGGDFGEALGIEIELGEGLAALVGDSSAMGEDQVGDSLGVGAKGDGGVEEVACGFVGGQCGGVGGGEGEGFGVAFEAGRGRFSNFRFESHASSTSTGTRSGSGK